MARKWVFPIIRIVLIAVVAAALVKVAFFPDSAEANNPDVPTGQIVEPQIPVALGSITNDVTLPGTVQADPAIAVRAVAQGTVDEVFAQAGQPVTAGDVLYDIKVEKVREPVETTDAAGMVSITQPRPVVTYGKVLAPITGTLSALTVLPGQSVAVGDTGGQVAPPTFSVSGALSPDQQYRLLTEPTEASIAITNGPAPFTCTGLTITTPLAGAGDGGNGGSGGQGAGTGGGTGSGGGGATATTVSCAIPPEIIVFPGLAAQITIAGGKVENVLVVPTTAVKGSAETGVVGLALDDGTIEQRPVTLGMSDGTMVQVIDGLAEGDLINQFVPGAVVPDANGCTTLPDGSMMCAEGGMAFG